MQRVLFITWDGPQTSYLEGLFIPIFNGLVPHGYRLHVLQFSWAKGEHVEKTRVACEAAGIPYRVAPVQRALGGIGPLATALLGSGHIKRAVRDWRIDTLMPRSLMPALAVLKTRERKELRLIFDADGFAVDERVDFAGLSSQSVTYRLLRAVESRTAQLADRVLVRTPRAIDVLARRSGADPAKFRVVGNGRNPAPFLVPRPERTDSDFRLCYAGSLGPQYQPDQMVELAQRLRAEIPNLIFRVFTGEGDALRAALDRARVSDRSWIEISRLQPEDMPAALMDCDLALALRKPAFSTQGVAPIKLGEYLLAGLPVIGTSGVGPVEPLIKAGLMFPVVDDLSKVWPWVRDTVLPHRAALRAEARALGLAHFSLEASVMSYVRALSALSAEETDLVDP